MSNDVATEKPQSAAILLLLTVADTTWRAFVPTIGGTIVGITLDHAFGTKPSLTVGMIVLGFIVSGILITLQFKSLRKK
jgi:hypothetical protein